MASPALDWLDARFPKLDCVLVGQRMRSPRKQERAAPILNTSGSARWFDVAGQGLKSRSCRRRPRNRNCKPRPCERLTRANTAMAMLMWNIVWDIGCATYYGAADMEYKTGYRMCYVLRRTRAHRVSRVRCPYMMCDNDATNK